MNSENFYTCNKTPLLILSLIYFQDFTYQFLKMDSEIICYFESLVNLHFWVGVKVLEIKNSTSHLYICFTLFNGNLKTTRSFHFFYKSQFIYKPKRTSQINILIDIYIFIYYIIYRCQK